MEEVQGNYVQIHSWGKDDLVERRSTIQYKVSDKADENFYDSKESKINFDHIGKSTKCEKVAKTTVENAKSIYSIAKLMDRCEKLLKSSFSKMVKRISYLGSTLSQVSHML